MNDINTNANFAVQFFIDNFNLSPSKIAAFSTFRNKDGLNIDIKLVKTNHSCPICFCDKTSIKDYVTKKIKHQVLNNENCTIIYHARRFKCLACSKSFYEINPFAFENSKLSAKTVFNVLVDLKNPNDTFSSVANRYFISPASVSSIFDRHIAIARKPLPAILLIDEVYIAKGDYACVLLDFSSQNLIDLLPSRRKEFLLSYFHSIPLKERENVELICMDMWLTYRDVAKSVFPNCLVIVDKFHVIADLSKKMQKVRSRIINRLKVDSNIDKSSLSFWQIKDLEERKKHYYLYKKFNWLLFKAETPDPNHKKKYNSVMQRYLNFYDIYHLLLNIDEEINTMNDIIFQLYNFYRNATIENAREQLDSLIINIKNCEIPEIVDFAKTITNWKREIINSFITVPVSIKTTDKNTQKVTYETIQKNITNGRIESKNKVIKTLKRNANGYKNFSRFRNRVLYCINKDARFHLNPIDSVVVASKERQNKKKSQ